MKKHSSSRKHSKLMIHREILANLSSRQFVNVMGGVGHPGETNVTIMSDKVSCDSNNSQIMTECC
jgi:hypothetical protein